MSARTPIPAGTIVDATVRGAVLLDEPGYPDAPGHLTIEVDGQRVTIPAGVATVVVVGPAGWPPRAGDVWIDGQGDAWLYDSDAGHLRTYDGSCAATESVLGAYSPLRLVYRNGGGQS